MNNRPVKLTTLDYFAVAVGTLCATFGLVMLFHALTDVRTPTAFIAGGAFLGFGIVRLRGVWLSLLRR